MLHQASVWTGEYGRICLLPRYVDVQGRYEEGSWCRGNEIEEPCLECKLYEVQTHHVLHIRVVSRDTVVQGNFIFFAVKKSRFAPTELVHLFRE